MIDRLERFLNWQSDMDWSWGLFLKWRPSHKARFNRRINVWTLCLCSCLVPVIIFLIAFVPILLLDSILRKSVALPVFDIAGKIIDIMLEPVLWHVIFFGSLLPLTLLPYIWAWNRRADRLSQLPPEETPPPVEGVWPPPPRVPGQ